MTDEFNLHPQLEKDCFVLGSFPLCRLLLMNDSNYPWFVLVPARNQVSEIFELSSEDQWQLNSESILLSKLLLSEFGGHKMNVAALGNVVPQLHIHHIVRYQTDKAWPTPIWGHSKTIPYAADELDQVIQKIKPKLPAEFVFYDL